MSKRTIAIIILAAIILGLGGVVFAVWPRYKTLTVEDMSWRREIDIETNTLVEDSDWSVPEDAVEVLYTQREVHHYNHVIDHYMTITEQKSRQVFDGYDITYTYRDLGNGFAEQVEHQTPRYRTEYYTETHQEPVYRDDPVYRTKYYYTIWRYVYDYTVTTSGTRETDPFWGEYVFVGDQREGNRREYYELTYPEKNKTKTATIKDIDMWYQFEIGQTYQVKMFFNSILEIKGEDE